MKRNRLFIVLAVAAGGACPASAAADAPWSAPVDIGPRVARVAAPSLQLTTRGNALLTWGLRAAEPATPAAPSTDRVAIASRASDGTLARTTLRDDVVTQVACGTRCVAVLRQRTVQRGRVTLGVSIGSGPTRLRRLQTLARYLPAGFREIERPDTPVIAAHPSGAVAVAWVEAEGRRLRVAMRRPGAAFGRPRTVAAGGASALHVPRIAFHGRDVVTVAWVRVTRVAVHTRRTVEARVVRFAGRLPAAQVVGPAPQSYTDLRIAAAPGGRAVVAWGSVHGTVSGFQDRWIVRAAIRERGSRRFGSARTLDPGAVKEAGAPGELDLVMASDGTATATWSAYTRRQPAATVEVRAATAHPGGRFAAAQAIGPGALASNAHLSDVAASPAGAVVATWTSYAGGFGRELVMAAVRPAGAPTFGPPEVVARIRTSYFNAVSPTPTAAIDDAGAATVVWAAEDTAGEPPMHVPMSAVLRLATRPGGGG